MAHPTNMELQPILLSQQTAGSNGKQSPGLKTRQGSHSQQGGLSGQPASLVQRESLLTKCLMLHSPWARVVHESSQNYKAGHTQHPGLTDACIRTPPGMPYAGRHCGEEDGQCTQGMASCTAELGHERHTDFL